MSTIARILVGQALLLLQHHKKEGLIYQAVVTSVVSQWPPACGDQRMCTQVQPIFSSRLDLKKGSTARSRF